MHELMVGGGRSWLRPCGPPCHFCITPSRRLRGTSHHERRPVPSVLSSAWLMSSCSHAPNCIHSCARACTHTPMHALMRPCAQGVRFKRVIMDDGVTDRSPYPPEELGTKRVVFCSGKVCVCARRAGGLCWRGGRTAGAGFGFPPKYKCPCGHFPVSARLGRGLLLRQARRAALVWPACYSCGRMNRWK